VSRGGTTAGFLDTKFDEDVPLASRSGAAARYWGRMIPLVGRGEFMNPPRPVCKVGGPIRKTGGGASNNQEALRQTKADHKLNIMKYVRI